VKLAWGIAFVIAATACGHGSQGVRRTSAGLGRAIGRGDVAAIEKRTIPAARAGVDTAMLVDKSARRDHAKRLRRAREVQLEATAVLSDGRVLRLEKHRGRWYLADDPSDLYRQDTPSRALAALVLATQRGRWDVVLQLAPRRYRVGLSAAQLEEAWTTGDGAAELRRARDRLARHLGDPIAEDAHEAVLDLGDGHVARLEREAGVWVVVDF
jgi:hypothetical protein